MEGFKVSKKENIYFALKVIFTVIIGSYLIIALMPLLALMFMVPETAVSFGIIIMYTLMIIIFVVFQKIIMIGYLKGNGVRVSEQQFPNVYLMYEEMGKKLKMDKLPNLYLLQSGGILNAYATRFSGKNYIAIYSEIFSLLEDDEEALNFIIGHELTHVKRKHLSKRFWTGLSNIVPFLNSAYSRSCELTCDNFGYALIEKKSLNGLVVLAAGKELYKNIDVDQYLKTAMVDNTAVVKFAGVFLSHPFLPKRIENLKAL